MLTVKEGSNSVSLVFAGARHSFRLTRDNLTGTLIVDPVAGSAVDHFSATRAFDLSGQSGWGFDAFPNDRAGSLAASDFLTPNPLHG